MSGLSGGNSLWEGDGGWMLQKRTHRAQHVFFFFAGAETRADRADVKNVAGQ